MKIVDKNDRTQWLVASVKLSRGLFSEIAENESTTITFRLQASTA